ncbi:MAG: hypothetical protein AB1414_05735 [bacterium]
MNEELEVTEEVLECERICGNCNQFLPSTMTGLTEFGICMSDEAFEPFIDELFEDPGTASCQDLINRKKIPCGQEACEEFEEVESVDLGDGPLAEQIEYLIETGHLNPETFREALIDEQIRNIDFRTLPVEPYVTRLKGSDAEAQQIAITTLGNMIRHKNEPAFKALLNFFKELPPPKTIEEVYFKKGVLKELEYSETRALLIPELIDELYQTPSNNTTRQWISAIFRCLRYCPPEKVREPLEKMLGDKRFSYKFKQKIKDILYQ